MEFRWEGSSRPQNQAQAEKARLGSRARRRIRSEPLDVSPRGRTAGRRGPSGKPGRNPTPRRRKTARRERTEAAKEVQEGTGEPQGSHRAPRNLLRKPHPAREGPAKGKQG
eukprot:11746519-Heterocapsa_arctica.AAC.1